MKPTIFHLVTLCYLSVVWSVVGHGHSPEMIAMLNAPPPEWLTVGPPLKAQPAESGIEKSTTFRASAGESESTRTRVKIPARGLEIRPVYPVAWYHGSSLSPDGTQLIINSGCDCHILQINSDGTHRELEIQVPTVTFDAGPKGFISGWFWGNNEVMLAEAEAHSDMGEFVDKRIYAYHLRERVLRRLDLSGLNLVSNEGLTVRSIGADSQHLVVALNDREFAVNVDFRPESVLAGQKTSVVPKGTDPAAALTPANSPGEKRADSPGENLSSVWALWLGLAVCVVVSIFFLVSAWRRKTTGK